MMRVSGYSEKDRFETIRGAHMRYQEMRSKVEKGEIQSLNRQKKEIQKMKEDKGGLTAGSWFLKGNIRRVMTCKPTPNGQLAVNLKKALNTDVSRGTVLVTEDGGQPAVSYIKKTDPFFSKSAGMVIVTVWWSGQKTVAPWVLFMR